MVSATTVVKSWGPSEITRDNMIGRAVNCLEWLGERRLDFNIDEFSDGIGVERRSGYRWLRVMLVRGYAVQTSVAYRGQVALYRSCIEIRRHPHGR